MKHIDIIKSTIIIILILINPNMINAQARKKADKETNAWHYEIQCVGVGIQGTYLIKVWSYSKKPKIAIEQAKKNAVHGIIFKGFTGGTNRCTPQKPLVRNINLDQEKNTFFKQFFADGGKYMKYVSLSNDGSIAAGDRLKIGRGEYKIGVIVIVRKDELRKDLENAGIIKGLSSGF